MTYERVSFADEYIPKEKGEEVETAGSLVSCVITGPKMEMTGLLTSSFPPDAFLDLKGALLKEITLEESTKLTIQSIYGLGS